MCRRCGEPDLRGNNVTRRLRKQRLIDKWGDGEKVDCAWQLDGICTGPLTIATLQVDRLTPGHAGGTYADDNVLPACGPCNRKRSYDDPDLPDGCAAGVDWPEWHPRHQGRTA